MKTDNTRLEEAHMGWGEDIFPRLSWWKQHKVSGARVMVAGCGALGNEVAKNLALFGVGHLWLVEQQQQQKTGKGSEHKTGLSSLLSAPHTYTFLFFSVCLFFLLSLKFVLYTYHSVCLVSA